LIQRALTCVCLHVNVQWVLHHTILHLLTAISDRDVATQGCQILKDVIDGTIAAGNSKFLTNLLREIICTLIPQATHHSKLDGAASGDTNLPLQIITILVSDAEKSRQAEKLERIQGLPPFPKLQMFEEVRTSVEKIRAASKSRQDITVFLGVFQDLKEPVPFEVQKATLLHLHEQLREHFKAASSSLVTGQQGRARLNERIVDKLLAWTQTADTYSQKDRHDIVELIGKCLGQLGPTLTSAPSPPTPLERIAATTRYSNKDDGIDDFFKRYRIELCVRIVKKLRSYLQEENVQVVEEAIKLLKGVFQVAEKESEKQDVLNALAADKDWPCDDSRTTDTSAIKAKERRGGGGGAVAAHDNDVQTFFEPFLNKREAGASGGAHSRGATLQRNQTARPPEPCWSTKDEYDRPRKYEEWLHDLSHALCRMDQSYDLWPRCQRMCQLKSDFAELIFPSLLCSRFLSSVEEECDDEVAREMGETLATHIFCENNDDLKAIRLVLQGLDEMRLVKQATIKNFFNSKNPKAATIRNWEYSYFFHVPYVEVAKAARRSGAHLSALMYLELHSQEWGSEPDMNREGRNELLLAYRAVEEPDGLDAFNKLRDFRSRYISWEHHGEYAKVVDCPCALFVPPRSLLGHWAWTAQLTHTILTTCFASRQLEFLTICCNAARLQHQVGSSACIACLHLRQETGAGSVALDCAVKACIARIRFLTDACWCLLATCYCWLCTTQCMRYVECFPGGSSGIGSAMQLYLERPVEQKLCGALHNIGFSQLAFRAAEALTASSSSKLSDNEDVFFESAWRAQAWQLASALVRPASHGVQTGYHNSLFAALKALASVKHVGRKESSRSYADIADIVPQHIQMARSSALTAFRFNCDSQSTKYSQSQLVRLQMCEDVESFFLDLLDLEKANAVLSSPSQSRGAFGSSSRVPSHPRKAALERMCNIWHSRYKMVDSEFALCEPLISLQAILLGISPHPELLEHHLCLAAKISMKQGNMSFARGSMQRLQMWFASESDGQSLGHPSPWWIREAKVLVCPPFHPPCSLPS